MIFQNNYLGKDRGVFCLQAERDRHQSNPVPVATVIRNLSVKMTTVML